MAQWSTSPSDPLISEHTLLSIADGAAWVVVDGESGTALLTLAATKLADIGLVEVAGLDDESRERIWATHRDSVSAEAKRRGYRSLEVIDRGDVLGRTGTVTVRGVVRMVSGRDVSTDRHPDVEVARATDTGAIVKLIGDSFADHPENSGWTREDYDNRAVLDWFDSQGLFITRSEGAVTGLCWTKIHPDGIGEIYLLAVAPDTTGQGLGRRLVEHGVGYLMRDRGCPAVIVYTEADNEPARALYRSVGFEESRVDRRFRLWV